MKRILTILVAASCLSFHAAGGESPKIVNIVNFIRQIEPRSEGGIEEELFETVASQVDLMRKCNLKGTFLLQYDAMINPRYQYLLRTRTVEGTEIGGWWEITEPHVKAAGLEWRGRYPWDWHADVGFSTGYTPEEREKLVDVFMDKFKEIFGCYPKSIGSWFIDAHTLNYMYEKYGIVASCNCKDQYGTDGYTMWGGYWNQAYYPSKLNAYMPAQTEEGQIPVPVFRMLGSDPVYQYDNGLGSRIQGVATLEPVCYGAIGGSCEEWIKWYMDMFTQGECMAFNYVQAGQENSFTWKAMKHGLEIQFPLIKELAKADKIKVMTLAEAGEWFKSNFKVTPPTSVVANDDYLHTAKQSIWYDSRFYRANLFLDGVDFKFRDMHLFDEAKKSDYLDKKGTSTQCVFTTLPVVDGFLWSTPSDLAGLRLVCDGKPVNVGAPAVKNRRGKVLVVKARTSIGRMRIVLKESEMKVRIATTKPWRLELTAAPGAELPFKEVGEKMIKAEEYGYPYSIRLGRGSFETGDGFVWRICPAGRSISIDARQQ